jgi:cytoskeleton protein RodZ
LKNEEQEKQPELLAAEWGAQLSSVRESLGITAEQMAIELNLPKDYIAALESGELDGLPSIVFARGYIRTYARFLKLDDDVLVADYERIHGQNSIKGQIKSVSTVRDQVKINDPVMRFSTWIFILIIIGLSVWWWQAQDGGVFYLKSSFLGSNEEAVESSVSEVVGNGESALVLPKLVDTPVGDENVTQQEGQNSEAVRAEAATEDEPVYLSQEDVAKLQQSVDKEEVSSATGNDVALSESIAVASEGRIEADFVAECWITVKDDNGKTLFNNLRGKGQTMSVVGKPPLSVLIGATSAVGSFSFNGSPIDFKKHSSKNIVRMSLPLAE